MAGTIVYCYVFSEFMAEDGEVGSSYEQDKKMWQQQTVVGGTPEIYMLQCDCVWY